MTTAVTKKLRSLKSLVPLIQREIRDGFRAGQRHWQAVGRLLNEARGHFPASGPTKNGQTFYQWVRANFVHPMTGEPLAERTVQTWMQATKQIGSSRRSRRGPALKSVTDNRSPNHRDYNPDLDWQAKVREQQQKLNIDALAEKYEDDRREARELRQLATRIIETGYRALAAVLHPDKPSGDKVAFQKLTKAKNWLKEAVRE